MSVVGRLAPSPAVFVGTCLVLGLVVGSFLNVVIYRLPVMLDRAWREQCRDLTGEAAAATLPAGLPARFNLVVPRSACPACWAPITVMQNIPLISWLVLRGRCAHCGKPISVRYPLVEALSGVLCAAVAWKFGFGWPALAAMVLTGYLIALTFIDIDHQLLPDGLTLPLLWLGLSLSLFGGSAGAGPPPGGAGSGLLGAPTGFLRPGRRHHPFRLLTGHARKWHGCFQLLPAP